MPPRNARLRGGVGGGATEESAAVVRSPSTTTTTTTPLPPHCDAHHNSDHPCCSILTRVAYSIFPTRQEANLNDCGYPLPDGNDVTHYDWYMLLRGYVLLERVRRREMESHVTGTTDIGVTVSTSNNKKKKKKKRKKKINAAVVPESSASASLHDSATEFFDTAENEEEGEGEDHEHEHDHTGNTGTTAISSTQSTLDEVEAHHQEASIPVTTTDATHDRCSVNCDEQLQQERIRRVGRLMDHFIDHVCHDAIIQCQEKRESITANTRQLHEFMATFRDRHDQSSNTKGATIHSPTRRKPIDHCPPTLITRKRIEIELQHIRCEACRRGVERILLPNFTHLSSTTTMMTTTMMIQYPPFRQLILKNLVIPTVYDNMNHELELEERAAEYQSLMEEGVLPPEHTTYWSFHLQTKEPPTRVTGDVIGWELRQPLVPQLLQQQAPEQPFLSTLPEPPLSEEMPSTYHAASRDWTMSHLKFLIDHYVLLLGLPADEVFTSTDVPTTTLTENDYGTISSNVSGKIRDQMDKFRDLANMMERSYLQFAQSAQYEVENGGCTTDWQTFAMLKNEIEETCRVVMNALLNINIEITRAVHRVLGHIGAGIVEESTSDHTWPTVLNTRSDALAETKWATTHCTSIWSTFLTGCISVINQREEYEARLFQLAEDRASGRCIPDMMTSPPARALYRAFVKTKLGIVLNVLQTIEEQLHASTYIGGWHTCCSTNTNATFMARLYTEDLFFTSIYGLTEAHECPEMDQSFENVLKTVREMTDTVHEQRVDVVLEKYQQQRDKLHRLLTKTAAFVDNDAAAPVMMLFRLSLESIQVIDWQDDSKVEFVQLQSTISQAIEIWIRYRLDYSVTGFTKKPTPIMPYELRRSMRPDATVLFSEQMHQCRGGNDEHRAICILVGLFFEGVSEKFKEWQAQRAAQELLTTFVDDMESAPNIQPTTPKTSKKQKKKGKKASQCEERKDTLLEFPQVQVDVITDSDDDLHGEKPIEATVLEKDTVEVAVNSSFVPDELDDATFKESTATVESEPGNKTNRIDSNQVVDMINHDVRASVAERNDSDTVPLKSTGDVTVHDNKCIATTVSTRLDDVVVHSDSKGNLDTIAKPDTRQKAGVYDTTAVSEGFQSAEDFLIGRFNQLLKSNETIVVLP